MSTEYLEIASSNVMKSTPSRGRTNPKKLVSAVVLMMVVAAAVIGVSSSFQRNANGMEEKNMLVSPAQDHHYYHKIKCTPGTYPVGKECKRCQIGNFCDGLKMIPCPPNKYQDCVGQPQCVLIPCGFEGAKKGYGNAGYTSIRACEKGSYRSQRMGRCKKVPAGSYGDEEGLCDYIKCYDGYFQSKPGRTSCPPCPCGSYSNKRGAIECVKCGKKEFQRVIGSQKCLPIPPSFVAKSKARCDIKLCPSGYYVKESTYALVCVPAPCGMFLPNGASTPVPCPKGYYQPEKAQTKCLRIPKGSELDTKSKRCKTIPCKPGYYQNEKGLDKCKPCRPGSYTGRSGTQTCDPCPCGEFASGSGSKACSSCPVAKYQPSEGQDSCLVIQPGYELSASGYASKKRCATTICQPGTYRGKSELGSDKCSQCPVGTSVFHRGARRCPPCKCGTYSNKLGATDCRKCQLGFYQEKTGKTKCLAVPYKRRATPSKCRLVPSYPSRPEPKGPSCKKLPITKEIRHLRKNGKKVSYVGSEAECESSCKKNVACGCYMFFDDGKGVKECRLGLSGKRCGQVRKTYYGKDKLTSIVYAVCTRYS